MREIKCRAWNTESNRMCEAQTLNQICRTYHDNGIAEGMVGMPQVGIDNEDELCGHLIWLEYTGLKDKNGKEIYEGDILDGWLVGWVVIEFKDGKFGFQHYQSFAPISFIKPDTQEVIGNIYENPDLLEVKVVRDKG